MAPTYAILGNECPALRLYPSESQYFSVVFTIDPIHGGKEYVNVGN